MPWDGNESNQAGVDCPNPGGTADGPWITMGTKELCEYTVERTDAAAASDRWLIDVVRSTNASRESMPHPRYMLESDETPFTFSVEGTYSFFVRVSNAESSETDTVKTDHFWRQDGMDL